MTVALNDIVADAAKLATPARTRGARPPPTSLGASGANEFEDLIGASSRAARKPAAKGALAGNRMSSPQASAEDPVGVAYRGLGAVLLQKTIETMLPDQSGFVASKGAAASIWKSMLAQQLAESISTTVFQPPGASGSPTTTTRLPTGYDHA